MGHWWGYTSPSQPAMSACASSSGQINWSLHPYIDLVPDAGSSRDDRPPPPQFDPDSSTHSLDEEPSTEAASAIRPD
jgi:hypothetical protein